MTTTIDVDELLEHPTNFLPLPTIAFETKIVPLIESCIRWQSEGVPFVIKGIPLDGYESPFLVTQDWLARLAPSPGKYTRRFRARNAPTNPSLGRRSISGTHTNDQSGNAPQLNNDIPRLNGGGAVIACPCPPEWSGWLHTSCMVPNCLIPHRSADLLPEHVDTTSCQLGVNGDGATLFLLALPPPYTS